MKPLVDLVGVQDGPDNVGNFGGVMVKPGGGHQAERVSWPSVQIYLWNYTRGYCFVIALQCGGQQRGPTLSLVDA